MTTTPIDLGGGIRVHAGIMTPELVPADQVTEHPQNPRRGDVDAIGESLDTNGLYDQIKVQRSTGYILAGNHTYRTLTSKGAERVPVVFLDCDNAEALRIMTSANATADRGTYDRDAMLHILRDDLGGDLVGTGYDDDDLARFLEEAPLPVDPDGGPPAPVSPSLADRFIVPPFSVLDARGGVWQDRKRRWLSLGIQSEVGRGDTAADGVSGVGPPGERWRANPDQYRQVEGTRKGLGAVQTNLDGVDAERYGRKPNARSYKGQESLDAITGQRGPGRSLAQGLQAHRGPDGTLIYEDMPAAAGVSIFDPVVCELTYRWFTPPGGHVLDPFAGGSVRGIVASALGLRYHGIELRGEQTAANEQQADTITPRLPKPAHRPRWTQGDSVEVVPTLAPDAYDLVFSCPPYADLEVYSDDPADLSNMPYDDFLRVYRDIITASVNCLAPNRFAVWVVGEVRDKRGAYRNLVGDTITAFQDAGCAYYNDAVLVTPVGSLPIRAGRQFAAGRKLGKTHQDVLVFCKGDPKTAVSVCGTVDVTVPEYADEALPDPAECA